MDDKLNMLFMKDDENDDAVVLYELDALDALDELAFETMSASVDDFDSFFLFELGSY